MGGGTARHEDKEDQSECAMATAAAPPPGRTAPPPSGGAPNADSPRAVVPGIPCSLGFCVRLGGERNKGCIQSAYRLLCPEDS